jgi:EpsI family protein
MRTEDQSTFERPMDRRTMLLGGLFAASAATVLVRAPHQKVDYLGANKLEKLIPKAFGRWEFATTSGLVVPPEDALESALYSQLLTRVYTDGLNAPVMLLIAQSAGQTGILQIHRPEVCYPAGGYQLSGMMPSALTAGPDPVRGNRLTATRPGRSEQILYWTRIGDSMPTTWGQQRWTIARDNLRGKIPDAVLVRVSSVDPDADAAFARLGEFIEAMVGALLPGGRRVLVA